MDERSKILLFYVAGFDVAAGTHHGIHPRTRHNWTRTPAAPHPIPQPFPLTFNTPDVAPGNLQPHQLYISNTTQDTKPVDYGTTTVELAKRDDRTWEATQTGLDVVGTGPSAARATEDMARTIAQLDQDKS